MAPPPKVVAMIDRVAKDPSKRDELLDQIVEQHAFAINRSESASLDVIRKRLRDLTTDVAGKLAEVENPNRKQLDRLTYELQQLVADKYDQVGKDILRLSKEAAKQAPEHVREAVKKTSTDFGFDARALSPAQISEAVEAPFFGWSREEWIDWHKFDDAARFDREIRTGYFLGESFPQIFHRVESVRGFVDKGLRRTARTAVQAAANVAAEKTYEDNADVLSGMRIVATLDNRTCTQCGPLDGKVLRFKSAHIRPPFHPNCRCFLAPVVRAGLLPAAPVRPPTWSDWITGQSLFRSGDKRKDHLRLVARQDEALGKSVANLLRSGAIAPSDLIDTKGRRRSLGELRRTAARKRRKAA